MKKHKKVKQLLGTGTDAKTSKGEALGILTGILYLAPHTIAGKRNACPWASKGCTIACLYNEGRGAFNSVQRARIAKTNLFFDDTKSFVDTLEKNILSLITKAKKRDMIPAVRLNGTSDIAWEKMTGSSGKNLMETFPALTFYDYTKSPQRALAFGRGEFPKNYHLTFSRSESNDVFVDAVLKTSTNVAVVFSTRKGQSLPAFYKGRKVIDGDISDVRFQDEMGVIVGLRAKGRSNKKDSHGFIITA